MERLIRPGVCTRSLCPTRLLQRSNGAVTTTGKSRCIRRKNYRQSRVHASESTSTLETASNGLPSTFLEPHPAIGPRSQVQDLNPWEGAFTPVADPWKADGPITSDALKAEICKCVDFVNLTYANFWSSDDVAKYKPEIGGVATKPGGHKFGPNDLLTALPGLEYPKVPVAEASPVRKYSIGIPGTGGSEGDESFYLTATSGFYAREFAGELQLADTNWIGYVGIGPRQDKKSGPGHRDIAIVFRGTQAKTEWITDLLSQNG
eukprot:jgi/Botrbrau1/301/Bobra.0022s0267.1